MTSTALQPEHRVPRDTLALVRLVLSWLLVAVLAVDLVTSPLHAHRHDEAWSAGGALGASSAHADDMSGPSNSAETTHIDHDDAVEPSHSLAALRTPVESKADGEPPDDNPAAVPWHMLAPWSPPEAAASVGPPDRHRAGSSAYQSLPPESRAPPLRG